VSTGLELSVSVDRRELSVRSCSWIYVQPSHIVAKVAPSLLKLANATVTSTDSGKLGGSMTQRSRVVSHPGRRGRPGKFMDLPYFQADLNGWPNHSRTVLCVWDPCCTRSSNGWNRVSAHLLVQIQVTGLCTSVWDLGLIACSQRATSSCQYTIVRRPLSFQELERLGSRAQEQV
jgi:hypothetical protein